MPVAGSAANPRGMLPQDRLSQIVARFEYLEARLNAGPAPDEIAAISREYAELKPVVTQIAEWRGAQDGIHEAQAMLADPAGVFFFRNFSAALFALRTRAANARYIGKV